SWRATARRRRCRRGNGDARTSTGCIRAARSPSRCSSATGVACSWSTATTRCTRTTRCSSVGSSTTVARRSCGRCRRRFQRRRASASGNSRPKFCRRRSRRSAAMWTRCVRTSSWSVLWTATAAAWMIGVVASTTPVTADTRWGADYFPNVTLTTQDGASVRFYEDLLKGKTVAIDLIYTTCQYACPLETARLAQVQRLLGDRVGRDIFFYSITIDPEHDTPAVLKDYAAKYHVAPGWTFLTGSAADIELISKKLGLYSAPNPDNPDGHTPSLLVGNEPTGQWMRNSALDN